MISDATMKELREVARYCPTLTDCLKWYDVGVWTLEEAMVQAAIMLARREGSHLAGLERRQADLASSRR